MKNTYNKPVSSTTWMFTYGNESENIWISFAWYTKEYTPNLHVKNWNRPWSSSDSYGITSCIAHEQMQKKIQV